MTGELMIAIAVHDQLLEGVVTPEDIGKARTMLEGDIRRALEAIKGELQAKIYEACPHDWKEDFSTKLVFCKHCAKNNGLCKDR